MEKLTDIMYERLNWNLGNPDIDLVRIYTIADGSCFFHALLNAYYTPYIEGRVIGSDGMAQNFDRRDFVRELRIDLANRLDDYYDRLSRGQLREMANQGMQAYLLENMKKELADPNKYVWELYLEYVSDLFNKDIYILDSSTQDVYVLNDEEILYKDRDSIVLLYLPGHFELIGIERGGYTVTKFDPDDRFISTVRRRLHELRYLKRRLKE